MLEIVHVETHSDWLYDVFVVSEWCVYMCALLDLTQCITMLLCMSIHMYVYAYYIHTRMHIPLRTMSYVYKYASVYIHLYIRIRICLCIMSCVHMSVHMRVYVLCVNAHVCAYTLCRTRYSDGATHSDTTCDIWHYLMCCIILSVSTCVHVIWC